MIAKSDATNDGSNYNLYWTKSYSDLSLTNYTKSDGTNGSGYLPKPDGTFGGSTHLSDDFTTWTNGALSDFNGKANTAVIAAALSHAKDMCTVLKTFNASDSFKDWYVPACGQLALMYLNMTEINAALAKIGGTALAAEYYWSSSEYSSYGAWYVNFGNGIVGNYICGKDDNMLVRFVRDISCINIKTINGESILGEGDIAISGAYAEVNHGTNDTTFELTPNTFHVWDEVVELDLSFGDEQAGVANEYLFQFTSGATATSLTLPDSIKFVNDSSLVIAENKIYQISILNGLGALLEFDNSVSLIENKITVSSSGSQYVVTSQYPVASDVKVSLYTADGTVNCTINSGSSVTYATPFGPIVDPDPSISNVEPNSDSTYIYSYL